jgi:hypothetical protein
MYKQKKPNVQGNANENFIWFNGFRLGQPLSEPSVNLMKAAQGQKW